VPFIKKISQKNREEEVGSCVFCGITGGGRHKVTLEGGGCFRVRAVARLARDTEERVKKGPRGEHV